jgi:hypothetical protein
VIEKQAPKIIRFNSTETSSPDSPRSEVKPDQIIKSATNLQSKSMHSFTPNGKDVKIMKLNNTETPPPKLSITSEYLSQFETNKMVNTNFIQSVKLRSNSFQRPNLVSVTKKELNEPQQQQQQQLKLKSVGKTNENLENIKPFKQTSPPTTSIMTQNLFKKTKIDSNEQAKTIINVTYNPGSDNKTSTTNGSNSVNSNNKISKPVQQIPSYNNVLTENKNNNKLIESISE